MKRLILVTLILLVTYSVAGTAAEQDKPPTVLMGNLSVGYLQWVVAGRQGELPPLDYATPESLAELKAAGVTSIEDYITFLAASPIEERLDFGYYRRNAEVLEAAGMEYTVYPWLHFVPSWFETSGKYFPYECLEHSEATFSTSIWAPQTLDLWDWFYSELARQLGSHIKGIYLGMPADYGEVGMPVGMTDWLVPERHFHRGFWCGDRYARRAWVKWLETAYEDVAVLNEAWGEDFIDFNEVEYPGSPEEGRQRWLDFISFYMDSELDFLTQATGVVRKHFGKEMPLQIKLGYGGEFVEYGVDNGATCKLAAQLGITVRSTHGKLPYYFAKRISTPCKFYQAEYLTEPPSNVDRREEVWRLFSDASTGARVYFDYPQNIKPAADLLAEYGFLLTGEQPLVSVAVLFPTTDHRLKPDQANPPKLLEVANGLREFVDWDVVDEQLVLDGALENYKVLVWPEGKVMQVEAQEKIAKWLRSGGILLKGFEEPAEAVSGDAHTWNIVESAISTEVELPGFRVVIKPYGKGATVVLPSTVEAATQVLLALEEGRLGSLAARPVMLDHQADRVLVTLFADRVLLYNAGDAPVVKRLELEQTRLKTLGVKSPGKRLPGEVTLAPHSMALVYLNKGDIFSGKSADMGGS